MGMGHGALIIVVYFYFALVPLVSKQLIASILP
jgi:hypothetical protein